MSFNSAGGLNFDRQEDWGGDSSVGASFQKLPDDDMRDSFRPGAFLGGSTCALEEMEVQENIDLEAEHWLSTFAAEVDASFDRKQVSGRELDMEFVRRYTNVGGITPVPPSTEPPCFRRRVPCPSSAPVAGHGGANDVPTSCDDTSDGRLDGAADPHENADSVPPRGAASGGAAEVPTPDAGVAGHFLAGAASTALRRARRDAENGSQTAAPMALG